MDNHNCKHVLISGASIAGPALAFWLNKYGFKVTIIEHAPELRKGGYRVDIRGVAVTVAERMGISDLIRQKAVRIRQSQLINKKGNVIASFDPDEFGMRQERDIEILRGDLSEILYEQTQDHVEYLFDHSIKTVEEETDGVKVCFQNGEVRNFDLLVAADGLRSNVRKLVFAKEEEFVKHLGYYISIFSIPNALKLDQEEIGLQSPGKVVNVFNIHKDEPSKALLLFSGQNHDSRDIGKQQEILTENFKNEEWELPAILKAMPGSPDFYFDAISQIHAPELFKGRTVLLGDAGYCPSPASGQGTSLAMVGAYVLACELAKCASYQEAFENYSRKMSEYIRINQELGLTVLDQMIAKTKTAIFMQNLFLRAMKYMPWRKKIVMAFVGKLQQKVDYAANAIELDI
ncbi:FAD-dependent monooxygenase [Pedobacter cryoconitis]|uniref:2-polyprenyl-6-methoxyphenol hydroxylase-like FAD-dependent oxidoreductase n=1 Tax=Pedobacter cryoconitis TaxID=188932 RepID=A0A7X0MI62_9SPHI|nr:FAD-dependent monooxygenase [Pedobacter cryoconitis]MBB6499834.1 2-polyprenyl-6-methoxyphenol hydroxylase-like FAD-dependent oxidoreductase [Pedobacter cryoconitis]